VTKEIIGKIGRIIKYSSMIIKIQIAKILRIKFPLIVDLQLTYRCNLRCLYCNSNNIKCNELDTNQIKNIIDGLKKKGCYYITLDGGEVLLREDINEIINYIYSKGIRVHLVTNGLLIHRINTASQNKLKYIILSLDGNKEAVDKIRGEKTFSKIIKSINELKDNGVSIMISNVLSKYSVREESLSFLLKLSLRKRIPIHFQPLYEHYQTSKNIMKIRPNKEELELAIERVKLFKKEYPQLIVNRLYELDMFKESNKGDKMKCYAGLFLFTFEPDGKLYPCCPSIGKVNPSEIVNRKEFNLPEIPRLEVCKHCTYRYVLFQNQLLNLSPLQLFHEIFNKVSSKKIERIK
jgi:MoaA/NifB/PqqE/SkfB family radical SAM enzyme